MHYFIALRLCNLFISNIRLCVHSILSIYVINVWNCKLISDTILQFRQINLSSYAYLNLTADVKLDISSSAACRKQPNVSVFGPCAKFRAFHSERCASTVSLQCHSKPTKQKLPDAPKKSALEK